MELVRLVDDINAQHIVLLGVGKAYAGSAYRRGESQVQNQRRIGIVLFLADIGGANAQDGVILEYSPVKAPR